MNISELEKAFLENQGRLPTRTEFKQLVVCYVLALLFGYTLMALGIALGFLAITFGRADFWIAFWTSLGFVGLFYMVIRK